MKEELCSTRILACYHPERETVLSSDASSFGLGAVLRQKQENGDWRPVAFVSRSLTPTEQRYAQIEKEAFNITWACECLQNYFLGRSFHVETDHRPSVPLLSTTLPALPALLFPKLPNHLTFQRKEDLYKEQQKYSFDRAHLAVVLKPLNEGA